MKVSVAMATYNGAAYLSEQLESIARQNCLPDELVLSDDGSLDSTLAIAHEFAARAPFSVRIEAGRRNVGTRANFSRAIALCRGRWIFLADQDDRWQPDKLRRTLAALESGVGMAFSNAALVNDRGNPLRQNLWDAIGFSARERQAAKSSLWPILLRRNVVTGATLAFDSRYRELLLPVPEGWMHDAWMALLLAAVAPAVAIDEPLIDYRQHTLQQIGAKSVSLLGRWNAGERRTAEDYRGEAVRFLFARDRLRALGSLPDPSILAALDEKAAHGAVRHQIHAGSRPRFPAICGELWRGRYRRYSLGWRSVFRDALGR